MNIDELTIGEAKQLARLFSSQDTKPPAEVLTGAAGLSGPPCPFEIGSAYFIRTVTFHLTGRVRAVVGGFLVLDDAAWIADSGRYADALKKGASALSEVEPLPDGTFVALSAITDASPWVHTLPKEQK